MDNDFAEWLIFEMNKREWSQSDLARSSGLSRQAISDYVNRKRNNPDENALKAIAHAFGYPPEALFRAAGILPPVGSTQATIERLGHKFEQLSDRDQEEILALIDFKLQQAQTARRKKTGPLGGTT